VRRFSVACSSKFRGMVETMVSQTRAVAYPYFFGIRASRILVVCITAPGTVDLRIPSGRLAELQIET